MSEYSEQLLLLSSKEDGEFVRVSRVEFIEVRGGTKQDVVKVVPSEVDQDRKPVRIKGPGKHTFRYPKGLLKVKRVAGTEPLTVLALCKRFYHGIEADARRSVRRASRQ